MSERSELISRLRENRPSREAYIGAKLKVLIPSQIRALRLKSPSPRQEDLAKAAEMKQSRISAMETPGAVNFNLETLVRLAAALKVGLIVKFSSLSEMVGWENSFSQDTFNATRIDDDFRFIGLDTSEDRPKELTIRSTAPTVNVTAGIKTVYQGAGEQRESVAISTLLADPRLLAAGAGKATAVGGI